MLGAHYAPATMSGEASRMKPSIRAALAATLLLCSAAALADNAAQATLSLDFLLIDLDPDDGIAPSLTAGPLAQTTVKSSAAYDVLDQHEADGIDFSSLAASSAAGAESGRASLVGQGLVGSVVFQGATSASATGGWSTASAVFDSAVYGFTLSPHTELEITGSFSVAAQTDASNPDGSVSWAAAYVPGGLSALAGTIVAQGITSQSFASDDVLDLHVNDSDDPLVFGMLIGVSTFSWTPQLATPMPEPAGALPLLAGLLVLAAARQGWQR